MSSMFGTKDLKQEAESGIWSGEEWKQTSAPSIHNHPQAVAEGVSKPELLHNSFYIIKKKGNKPTKKCLCEISSVCLCLLEAKGVK